MRVWGSRFKFRVECFGFGFSLRFGVEGSEEVPRIPPSRFRLGFRVEGCEERGSSRGPERVPMLLGFWEINLARVVL